MMLMIGTSAVDPCDVALIGANGSGSLVVLADGVNLLSALAPAAQAAAVDAAEGGADPLMLVLPSASGWTGPVYVGGQHVQRIAPANGVLGSSWSLRGGPPIFALNTTVAAGLALVDATGRCGGGGGGTVPEWDVYTPNYTPGVPGVTASGDLMWYQIPPSNEEDGAAYFLAGFIDVNNSTMSPILNPQITVGLPPGAVTGDVVSFVLAPNNPNVRAWVAVFGPDASTFDIVVDELPASGSQYMQLIASFTPGAS